MSNGIEVKERTLNSLLADCHQVCVGIEERLATIVAAPPSDAKPGEAPPTPEPDTIADLFGQDHLRAVTLCGRLRRIEEHLALAQERLKALA